MNTQQIKTYSGTQLNKMSSAQLENTVKEPWQSFFPGKAVVKGSWKFYLTDGMVYNMMTGMVEGDQS